MVKATKTGMPQEIAGMLREVANAYDALPAHVTLRFDSTVEIVSLLNEATDYHSLDSQIERAIASGKSE